ncbi:hypothetical protein I3843_04G042400 [Carya illinoinensis]|uniref:Uncharacterized protein n=1 Tax=Carya illinoinensis TaxID=32201 RepID=A0A8T1QRL1_CARIL|nr:uncharacterized protein LOC122308317 isoform X1 [Carya illinoinensis]KAG2710758.1 hypothetical protein I3760_04G043400 [Carya illinoinensis]KAG6656764.1 hypothetical protein CIPAW_04G044500 [Carya illinoinensis]KAG7982267.1 hypothetical protein I3843_04G042400 [Carya illinoinensis]KAG7982268.1 hypothetical protein I3843_04G042400 [Carya illinoinensis]
MIKRRFYKLEHADKDQASDSSSSSDSELEAEAIDDSDDDVVAEVKENEESCSTSSGYECEDSSANEVDLDSSGLTIVDDDAETGNERQILTDSHLSGKCGSEALETHSNIMAEKELLPADIPACIMKCKSVFKCRICPRIICLNEETLRAHLDSKRHARSEKLLNEGRLKAILNSDGEIENQETPAEMNARILALPLNNKKRKSRNRLGEEKRQIKKEMGYEENIKKARKLTKGPSKKRHKNEN